MNRFSFSSESFAVRRIKAITDAIQELKAEYPEVIAGTLFGSLTKGTAREQSDVDLYVFINPDAIAAKESLVNKRMNYTRLDGEVTRNVTMSSKDFTNNVTQKYQTLVRNKIQEMDSTLSDEQVRDIIIAPLTEDIIDFNLSELVDCYTRFPEQEPERGVLDETSIKHLESSTIIPAPPNAEAKASDHLWGLFFFDIGEGLQPYRRHLIKYLLRHGEIGEKAWGNIMRNIELWEQKADFDDLPTKFDYPRTLAESITTYC